MDIFRVLSRGASLRKSKEVTTDYSLPKVRESESKLVKKKEDLEKQVDRETDFFHTRKHESEPKDKVEDADEEEEEVIPPPKINTEEELKILRKSYNCKVTGTDIPLPIGSFEDLINRFLLDRRLLKNLIDSDFTEPTPIQSEAIPISLLERDLISCAPTGSGKTLAFLIPLVQKLQRNKKNHGIRGLIISPTNELSLQIYNELLRLNKGKNLEIGLLSSSMSKKLKRKDITYKKFDILISTPLRLIDLVKNEDVELKLDTVEQLVFDEADKLFDADFSEQSDDLLSLCTNVKLRKSIFSATIPSSVEEMAQSIMNDPVRVIIGHKEAANSLIDQKIVYCGNEQGKLLAIRQMIINSEFKPPIIIFLQSVVRAKALFHELLYDRLNVDVIHSEKSHAQRNHTIERFKNGDIWCLICTDVLARGIDFKCVNLVINYDVPQSAQAYVHRIGRTGRGGNTGRAVTFFTKEDSLAIKPIINVMKQSGCTDGLSEWMENTSKINKRQKQQIKQKPIERKAISTVPHVVKQKKRNRVEMIEASKRRKLQPKSEEAEESD